MPTTSTRLFRRALTALATTVLTTSVLAISSASATTSMTGSVAAQSSSDGNQVTLSSGFGSVGKSGRYIFDTEVYDVSNHRVAQFSTTKQVTRSQAVSFTYAWDRSAVSDGSYVFKQGVFSSNWASTLAWQNHAGGVLLAPTGWSLSADTTNTTSNTGGLGITGHFVAPAAAHGSYVLKLIVKGRNSSAGTEWDNTTDVVGGQSIDIAKQLTAGQLPNGTYDVNESVFTLGWPTIIAWKSRAGQFSLNGSVVVPTSPVTTVPPVTTTTTVPPVTTTTVPPTTTTTTVPPTTTTTTTTPAPAGVDAGWKVLTSDDFNGTSLDSSIWYDPYEGPGNEGVGTRSPSAVTVSNGLLNIAGSGTTGGGMMMSSAHTYGRYEIRARMDKGSGYGPAVLLWPSSENWPTDGEIDISEMPEGDRSLSHFTVHYGADNSQVGHTDSGDFSQWHTYGVEWEADHITYFLDGQAKYTITDPAAIPRGNMNLAIQNDVGADGHWIPGPDANTPAQVNLQVDWVKVFAS